MPAKPRRRPSGTRCRTAMEAGEGPAGQSVGAIFHAGASTPQTEGAEMGVTNGADREPGEEVFAIVVEPDPRLEQLRRLDDWLSHLTIWQLLLVTMPFALVIAGIAIWLSSAPPPVDLKFTLPFASFGDVGGDLNDK